MAPPITITLEGFRTDPFCYYPGEIVKGNLLLSKKRTGSSKIVSSEMSLARTEQTCRLSSSTDAQGHLYTTSTAVHTAREVVSQETSGITLAGAGVQTFRSTFRLAFRVPAGSPNTSFANTSSVWDVPMYYHSNTYGVCVTLNVSHSDAFGTTRTDVLQQHHKVLVGCPAPAHPRAMTTGVSLCWGSGSVVDLFRSTHHLSVMVRCTTSSFEPGEDFIAQVAILNKTGKHLRKIDLYYAQDITVYEVSGVSRGEQGRKMNRAVNPFPGREGDDDDEAMLKKMLHKNSGKQYSLTVPSKAMAPGFSFEKASVVRRYIVFKPRFFFGASDTIKFPV